MWPIPLIWERIKAKTGDDVEITLSQVERQLLLGVVINAKQIAEISPSSFNLDPSEKDNFDSTIDGLLSKIVSQ
jgi:hypothetical protein